MNDELHDLGVREADGPLILGRRSQVTARTDPLAARMEDQHTSAGSRDFEPRRERLEPVNIGKILTHLHQHSPRGLSGLS
jgi:hypothetical protein